MSTGAKAPHGPRVHFSDGAAPTRARRPSRLRNETLRGEREGTPCVTIHDIGDTEEDVEEAPMGPAVMEAHLARRRTLEGWIGIGTGRP